jgi:hypothetical protein
MSNIEQRAAAEAQRVYIKTLNIFGGTDGGVGFVTLKGNMTCLYGEYQRNPTHEMTQFLTKIQDAFALIEKLAE